MTLAPLRVGVIGVGLMGTDHAERLSRRTAGVVLAGVTDPDTGRAAALAERLDATASSPTRSPSWPRPRSTRWSSPRRGSCTRSRCWPASQHGKAVLCEKPLTMDDESALRLVQAEAAARPPPGHRRVHAPLRPGVRRGARPRSTSGAHGRLLLLHNTHRNRSVPDADFRSEMIVRDSLVHEVDASRFLFGEEVAEMTVLSPAPTSHAGAGVVDPQVAVFRMAGGGLVTTEVFVNSQVGYEVRFEAVAERGIAHRGPRLGRRAHHPGRRRRRVLGRRRARRLPRPLRPRLRHRGAGLGRCRARRRRRGPVGLGRLRRDGGEHGGDGLARHRPAGAGRASPNDRRSTAATTDHGCEPASDHAFHNHQVL